ncbi:MAG: 4-hydroxy-tetrahydrodipicolinate reductase [Clostridia bacterium]|nr:4-hydroxy-tetrahydrodipicolinate reductase [Clostridia bacterium]
MIKILLSGCNGRMGRAICDICANRDDLKIVAGLDINTTTFYDFPVYDDIHKISEVADVVIDFSNPQVLKSLLSYCVDKKLPVVISTTGHSETQIAEITAASKIIPIFRSGNMSLGINVLLMLVERAATILGDTFDVEVIEKHHNQKVDAPSGTALMIADRLKESLPYDAEYVYDRHTVRQKRDRKEIGIHSIRGGTIVGEHEVIFAGRDEIVEIKHTAQSREVFAAGAVKAGAFLAECDVPGLYNMDDLVRKFINL